MPVATNADYQRAWRQRQKAKLAELQRQVLTIRRQRPRQAKLTGEANDFIHELLTLTSDYINRTNVWRERQVKLDAEDREALRHSIHQCANELSMLAQSFLPELTESAPKPRRARRGRNRPRARSAAVGATPIARLHLCRPSCSPGNNRRRKRPSLLGLLVIGSGDGGIRTLDTALDRITV